jgi:hypothetical protein
VPALRVLALLDYQFAQPWRYLCSVGASESEWRPVAVTAPRPKRLAISPQNSSARIEASRLRHSDAKVMSSLHYLEFRSTIADGVSPNNAR